jgi:hypothetical protein
MSSTIIRPSDQKEIKIVVQIALWCDEMWGADGQHMKKKHCSHTCKGFHHEWEIAQTFYYKQSPGHIPFERGEKGSRPSLERLVG